MSETPPEKPKEESAAKPAAEAAKPAAPAAGAAAKAAPKAAPKAKPKAAAKPLDPLIDNGDGTITDPNSGYMWKQSDAWLDCHKFFTFEAAAEYIDNLNKEKFAGHEDWRMPNKAEATTLVDKTKTKKCLDKNGTTFPLDPIFTEGRVCNTWITECTPEKVIRFDFKIGGEMIYPPSEVWASIYAVRGEAKPKEEAKPAAAAAKPAPAGGAAPAAKPAAGATAAASTKSD